MPIAYALCFAVTLLVEVLIGAVPQANLKFALTIEPANLALQQRAEVILALRADGKPTVPTTIGLELDTNPFLRPLSPLLRRHIGVPYGESAEATFARIRKMKDNA